MPVKSLSLIRVLLLLAINFKKTKKVLDFLLLWCYIIYVSEVERVMIRVGCFVRHLQEPRLGTGRVVALQRARNRVLVIWETGVQTLHDLRVVRRAA